MGNKRRIRCAPVANGDSETGVNHWRERTKVLLVDRFGLKAHLESRESSIYVLVAQNGRAKSKPSVEEHEQISWNTPPRFARRWRWRGFATVVIAARVGRPKSTARLT